jgi:hypothetical protein
MMMLKQIPVYVWVHGCRRQEHNLWRFQGVAVCELYTQSAAAAASAASAASAAALNYSVTTTCRMLQLSNKGEIWQALKGGHLR